MANKYLGREDAPFGASVWEQLDGAMIAAAKSQLVGRRLLHIEGPYGLGLKMVPTDDAVIAEGAPEVVASTSIPLALIRTTFTLGARDLASYERDGVALDLANVAQAAMACARLGPTPWLWPQAATTCSSAATPRATRRRWHTCRPWLLKASSRHRF